MLYIDTGSSTIKLYKKTRGTIKLLETKSFDFKKDFNPDFGLTEKTEQELIKFFQEIKKTHPGETIKVFATALFRKMSKTALTELSDKIFQTTGLYFNVISQDLEGYYLEQALSAKCTSNMPILLINIGGGSTELIVMKDHKSIEKVYLDLGVKTVFEHFPYINDTYSKHSLDDVTEFIRSKLPSINSSPQLAIYNGGELTYMQLAKYSLQKNSLFNDEYHPNMISLSDFKARNCEIFQSVKISELESYMPDDPLWMHGARACSAIAQAICEKFHVTTIVPSDSNTIHGMARQELRTVVLSGSFRKHLDYILSIKNKLIEKKIEILSPRFDTPKNPGAEFVVFNGEENMSPLELERFHLRKIDECDALIVCNKDGYVGASSLIEIGYAVALGKRIIFTEKPEEYMLTILPSEVGLDI